VKGLLQELGITIESNELANYQKCLHTKIKLSLCPSLSNNIADVQYFINEIHKTLL